MRPLSPLPPTAHSFRPDATPLGEAPNWLANLPARPTVYVTLGTQFNIYSGDLFKRILAGLRELPVNVIATVGRGIDPAEFGPQPDNVRIEQFVDQFFLLPRCDVMVSHAGSGSVSAALAHGVPMLLLPLASDQVFNGQRAALLGVAQVLGPVEATPESIREAVTGLLDGEGYREAAARFKQEIAALAEQQTAITLLHQLVKASPASSSVDAHD